LDIGSVDDLSKPEQCRVGQAVLFDNGLEGTFAILVPKLNTWGIKRDRTGLVSHLIHPALGDEDEFGIRIDETPDQPRARNPVNMDVRTSYPFHNESPFLTSVRDNDEGMFLYTDNTDPAQDMRDFVSRILFLSFNEKSVFFSQIRSQFPNPELF
jgi:hypothetical protein